MTNRFLLCLTFLVAGCGDDATPAIPECEAIAERCHPLDPGAGPIHECHQFAESATTAAMCTARHDECFATCVAATDAGTGTDAGMSGTDAGMSGTDAGMSGTDAGMSATDAGSAAMVTLTVQNYLAWCSVSVNGGAASTAAVQTVMVPAGTVVDLNGMRASPTFVFGYWFGTAGDTGPMHDRMMMTTVTVDADKTVQACCPFASAPGEPCPPPT